MLFHMVQSVRAESIGATARQSMDGAERGTPVGHRKHCPVPEHPTHAAVASNVRRHRYLVSLYVLGTIRG